MKLFEGPKRARRREAARRASALLMAGVLAINQLMCVAPAVASAEEAGEPEPLVAYAEEQATAAEEATGGTGEQGEASEAQPQEAQEGEPAPESPDDPLATAEGEEVASPEPEAGDAQAEGNIPDAQAPPAESEESGETEAPSGDAAGGVEASLGAIGEEIECEPREEAGEAIEVEAEPSDVPHFATYIVWDAETGEVVSRSVRPARVWEADDLWVVETDASDPDLGGRATAITVYSLEDPDADLADVMFSEGLDGWAMPKGGMSPSDLATEVIVTLNGGGAEVPADVTPNAVRSVKLAARATSDETKRFTAVHGGSWMGITSSWFGRYYESGYDDVEHMGYCVNFTKKGDVNSATYSNPQAAGPGSSYILKNGYPYTTTIGGVTWGAGQARAITQIALWYYNDGYHSLDENVNNSDAWAAMRNAAYTLFTAAQDYAASGGKYTGVGTLWVASNANTQNILMTPSFESSGWIEIRKASSNEAITDGNACYSLSGAVYGIYSDPECTQKVGELTTDSSGYAKSGELATGDYWVREIRAPRGYVLDTTARKATVAGGETASISLLDAPGNDPAWVLLRKVSSESGASPQGPHDFSGAQFRVEYFDNTDGRTSGSPERTWIYATNPNGFVSFQTAAPSGDATYRDSSGRSVFPLGTYRVTEVSAPDGYLLTNPGATHVAVVTADGSGRVSWSNLDGWDNVSGVTRAVADAPKRGDVSLRKVDASSGEAMAGVSFTITSKTTGESHAFVTGPDGTWSSSSSHVPHSQGTNGNDGVAVGEQAPGRGVWFTGTTSAWVEPDDSVGALPCDTYVIHEVEGPATEGYFGIEDIEFTVTEDGVTVEVGDVSNVPVPEIGTKAHDAVTGTQEALATGSVSIVDTVSYQRLIPGSEYTVKGELHIVGEGGEDGGPVEGAVAEATFTPDCPDGSVDVTFTFDAAPLEGHDVVAFEQLYDAEGVMVCDHEDISDGGQTIHFPEIGTTLTGNEGTHEACATATVTLTDTIEYKNLIPGKTYTVTGTLMDKATGESLGITATASFTPSESEGTTTVTFTFEGARVAGKTVVAFEEVSNEGGKVAVHADINDDEQTVSFPKVGTTAKDAVTGTQSAAAGESVSIVDTVEYENLIPGATYTVRGTMHLKGEGGTDAGAIAEAEATFTAESASGSVDVTFTFDGSALAGREVVAFERLYNASGVLVGSHEDISDGGQTIVFPSLGTKATDKADGDQRVLANTKVTIVDTVSYTGLVPGETYTVSGEIHVRKAGGTDGGVLRDASGNPVTASTTFTAEAADGTVTVEFTVDTTGLAAGTELVVFEDCQNGAGIDVCWHQDIGDEGQTVTVFKPGIPATGDETARGAIVALTTVGLVVMAVAGLQRRRLS